MRSIHQTEEHQFVFLHNRLHAHAIHSRVCGQQTTLHRWSYMEPARIRCRQREKSQQTQNAIYTYAFIALVSLTVFAGSFIGPLFVATPMHHHRSTECNSALAQFSFFFRSSFTHFFRSMNGNAIGGAFNSFGPKKRERERERERIDLLTWLVYRWGFFICSVAIVIGHCVHFLHFANFTMRVASHHCGGLSATQIWPQFLPLIECAKLASVGLRVLWLQSENYSISMEIDSAHESEKEANWSMGGWSIKFTRRWDLRQTKRH